MKNKEEIEDYFMLCCFAPDARGYTRDLLECQARKIGINDGHLYKNKTLLMRAIQERWQDHFLENLPAYEEMFKDNAVTLKHLKSKLVL
jgi:hypothetical protein